MKNKKRVNKLLIFIAGTLLILSFITLAIALTDDERQSLNDELSNPTQYLNDNNYGWLVDYNLTYPSVHVYREGSNELLAQFGNIIGSSFNKYKIFLTNLEENESYSTFDLRSAGDVEKTVPHDILLEKLRLDKIKIKLNKND